ncbi:MAG TPA: hypothetical protein IAB01_00555 [Candidatus Avidesulfovibrio excrementigallinarum]|nr:hypothetical protein [Candidatus Avidesulfovibrio excrementigallinarum]
MFSFKQCSPGRIIWLTLCSLSAALWLSEIWEVKRHPEAYAPLWSGEGPVAGLWYYASEQLYILHLAALALWFGCGMLLSLHKNPIIRKLLPAHVLLSVLWVLVSLCQPE